MSGLELWAGAECTVNRVGDRFLDQIRRTGHHDRLDDVDRLAELGARRVRFPVLWERVAPEKLGDADFGWSDARLERLRGLGVDAVVGLVHHGSGPAWTNLGDEGFVTGLAAYAERVARRYPWVEAFTPVNEPLTTARFSGLYGHWYPHARSTHDFLRMLLIQVRAVRAAMAAIRRVTPGARLIQTEDFGRTYSTPTLAYQARYENLRRWLSFDLLFGRVDRRHPLRAHLEQHGIEPRWLDELVADPCPPDLIGINYYLTSDRFLDERLERYPDWTWGGNARQAYADLEAVRVLGAGIAGHRRVLDEAAARYGAPVAITEAHVGCTREEQLRWFREAWQAARGAREDGADVRAVTLWAAFGSMDWSSLVTLERGDYEPGAYDVRGPAPRPTALVGLARSLAAGSEPDAPALAEPGWWWTGRRLIYPVVGTVVAPARPTTTARPLWILGGGSLARAAARACEERALRAVCRERVDPAALASLGEQPPWAVLVAALPGASHEALTETHLERLAAACAAAGVPLCVFSSETVFDGRAPAPYVENHTPEPRVATGHACRRRERRVLESSSRALVVRTGFLFGVSASQHELDDPLTRALRRLAHGERVLSTVDVHISPAYVPHVITATLDLLIDGASGVWHLSPREVSTPFEILHDAADAAGIATPCLERGPQSLHGLPFRPMRALASTRGVSLPGLDGAVRAFAASLDVRANPPSAAAAGA